MKAYALVQGPRRKVLAVSDSRMTLWMAGACMFDKDVLNQTVDKPDRHYWAICKANGCRIVPISYQFDERQAGANQRAATINALKGATA